jgi:predicted amidohydrolase YtcJ
MHRFVRVIGVATTLLSGCSALRGPDPAEIVLFHGHIAALGTAQSAVEALGISQGRVVATGTDGQLRRFIGADTRVIDLGGRTVLPGLEDAHVHLLDSGLERRDCQIVDLPSRQAVFDLIGAFARAHPTLAWIRGSGWELPTFPEGNPRKEWLDALVPNRPAFFPAADAHSAWVNSRALALAHITRDTPDPPGGRIEHDATTGEPSGTLREGAQDLVAKLLPPRTDLERRAALLDSLAQANQFGITAIIEANADEDALRTFSTLDREGKLTVRVVAAQATEPALGIGQVPRLLELKGQYTSPMFSPSTAKFFVDGVMESHTAAMLAPYVDAKTGQPTQERGLPLWRPEVLNATLTLLDKAGMQGHMHAIGDEAVRFSLNAVAAARQANGEHDMRHTIAHLELVDEADVPRFRELNVVADFQPFWCIRDEYIKDLTEPVLGPQRSSRLYPLGELWRSGAALAFGSDWSVSSLNPLDGIQVAVTRRALDATTEPAWLPAQMIDRETAIRGYTLGAAYAAHRENQLGSLEVGKAADLVVLDGDIFAVPVQSIHTLKPLLTMVAGKSVYRATNAQDLGLVPPW